MSIIYCKIRVVHLSVTFAMTHKLSNHLKCCNCPWYWGWLQQYPGSIAAVIVASIFNWISYYFWSNVQQCELL